MKKRRIRRLWGRDFDAVGDGLAEDQVVAFVEDLVRRYNDLLGRRGPPDSSRELAERKPRGAEQTAVSIVREAREHVTGNAGEAPRRPAMTAAQGTDGGPPAAPEPDRDVQKPYPGVYRQPPAPDRAGQAIPTESGPGEEPRPASRPYEMDILLQGPWVSSDSPQLAKVLEHLERSEEMSLKRYLWSPSTGWIVTVWVGTSVPAIPLLMAIPEVLRVAEEGPAPSPFQKGHSPDRQSPPHPRKRLRVWLKSDGPSR